jgi:hypothetical protein
MGAIVRRVNGDFGYKAFSVKGAADGTVFDARLGSWKFQTYPEIRGMKDGCWAGGLVVGTLPADRGWRQIYDGGNGAGLVFGDAFAGTFMTNGFRVEGVRLHNVWDGIRVRHKTQNFVIKDVWLSHVRDDCIENDHMEPGQPGRWATAVVRFADMRVQDRPTSSVRPAEGAPVTLLKFRTEGEVEDVFYIDNIRVLRPAARR